MPLTINKKMKKEQPLEPSRDEFSEWLSSKKNIFQETFDRLPRAERLALARECGSSDWLLRRRSPHWAETAEAAESQNFNL